MNTNKRLSILFIAAALIIISFLTSCGGIELAAPGGIEAVDADPDYPNRVEISWLPVDGADIYYVYRSSTENGTYSNAGFSVTSDDLENADGVTELRFSFRETFDEGDGGTYYYRVTAASNADISLESSMSSAVAASTYSGTWNAAKALGNAGQLKLAADTSALYAVYSGSTAGSVINVKKYAEDADSAEDNPPMIWTSLGSPGTTNGSALGPYAAFITGGELYTVFNDQNASTSGAVSMQYYHDSADTGDDPVFSWEALGTAGFNGAVSSQISAATVGFGGTIYAAFNDGTADGRLFKYSSASWFEISLAGENLPVTISTPKLLSHNNSLYFGYEEDTFSSETLYLRAYDDATTSLATGGLVEAADINDGNAVFVSGGGDLYAVYTVGSTLKVRKLDNDTWTLLSSFTVSAGSYGSLAAAWFNGYLYVFYLDASGDGWVKYYDEGDGWLSAEKNGTAITGGGTVSALQLASSGTTTLYAGYIEGGQAYVRILE